MQFSSQSILTKRGALAAMIFEKRWAAEQGDA
jgi:hypothetical protein